ncbi:pimeloyl-ACP methyl ester carboxylesterase [Aminivibrio pyruvatiphilus]|uniref:Pimeloyl-ACP methyl ester carboxylesterase n=1 Tax=Aminivibrio pyruvatiphilus TaxID=1005740 RepID=A0A4R8MAG1_9BACT|nr:alpha/beta hydrolase [Aminivibrio pyruvatiphilus]TDY61222.1 pimeloyl-ACP methyl ester carboxylesterase [Aminivibrio pyruvatiphilus]
MATLILASMLMLSDVELYYEVHGGDGPPLLLVAGLASDVSSWQTVLPALSEHFRVIVVDNRGIGRSVPEDAPVSVDLMADDCAALIDYLGYGPVHVLGHSMGGFTALSLAARYPDRVKKLVLAATGEKSSSRNTLLFSDLADLYEREEDPAGFFRTVFYWIFSPAFFEDKDTVKGAVEFALSYPFPQAPVSFRNQVNAIAAFDGRNLAVSVSAPTLVLSAAEDLLFASSAGRELAEKLPRGKYLSVEGAAHSIHAEKPKEFAEAVVSFLKEGENP